MTAVLSDPSAARAHARSMAGTRVESMPVLPPIADDLPEGVAGADLLWEETIAPGGYATRRLARGTRLRRDQREVGRDHQRRLAGDRELVRARTIEASACTAPRKEGYARQTGSQGYELTHGNSPQGASRARAAPEQAGRARRQ